MRDAHARYIDALTRRVAPELEGPSQREAARRLDLERGNLRTAMRHLVDVGDADLATDIAWRLYLYWWLRGFFNEVRLWMKELLERVPDASAHARAVARFYYLWSEMWTTDEGAEVIAGLQRPPTCSRERRRPRRRDGGRDEGLAQITLGQADDDVIPLIAKSAESFRRLGRPWGETLAHDRARPRRLAQRPRQRRPRASSRQRSRRPRRAATRSRRQSRATTSRACDCWRATRMSPRGLHRRDAHVDGTRPRRGHRVRDRGPVRDRRVARRRRDRRDAGGRGRDDETADHDVRCRAVRLPPALPRGSDDARERRRGPPRRWSAAASMSAVEAAEFALANVDAAAADARRPSERDAGSGVTEADASARPRLREQVERGIRHHRDDGVAAGHRPVGEEDRRPSARRAPGSHPAPCPRSAARPHGRARSGGSVETQADAVGVVRGGPHGLEERSMGGCREPVAPRTGRELDLELVVVRGAPRRHRRDRDRRGGVVARRSRRRRHAAAAGRARPAGRSPASPARLGASNPPRTAR